MKKYAIIGRVLRKTMFEERIKMYYETYVSNKPLKAEARIGEFLINPAF
jgi:hypothetical protein